MMQDAIANTITIDPSTPVPGTFAIGTLLIVDGGAGVANSQPQRAPGLCNSIPTSAPISAYSVRHGRDVFPARSSLGTVTPSHPSAAGSCYNQVRLALGIDTPESAQWFWYMLVDQEAAIENIGLIVSQVIQNQLKGESSVDMLMKTAPKTFGGRPIKTSQHGIPGRIDGIAAEALGTGADPADLTTTT